ncbi:MAG TPA: hypothetical protein VGH14_02055 [Solirubrobacterales bacterium]|jgi:hypothetical protein
MSRRTLFKLLVVRWGFAAMVALAVALGFAAAATVAPPTDLPTVSLGAMPVYRVEVGAAVFFGLYVATMALVLAMHNRGFTELGTGGIRATGLAAEEVAGFEELVLELMEEVSSLQALRKEREDGDQAAT